MGRWDNMKGVIIMNKEWRKKAKLVSVVPSNNYRMIMFSFVSSYCSHDDELIRISQGMASFRRKHGKTLSFFGRCFMTF
jgi:hypothetical protein